MFGFNKEAKEAEKVSKCWERVKRVYTGYLPEKLFDAEKHETEGMLFGLTNIYPVLRFMLPDLQREVFKERVLEVSRVVPFFSELNDDLILSQLKKWREENVQVVIDHILEQEGLGEPDTARSVLRRQQLKLSLSKDPNLLVKRAAIEKKFMPNYVTSAINATFDGVLTLELSSAHSGSHNA